MCPNGETPLGVKSRDPDLSEVGSEEQTEGIETSQYLQEKKSSKRFPE